MVAEAYDQLIACLPKCMLLQRYLAEGKIQRKSALHMKARRVQWTAVLVVLTAFVAT